MFNTGQRVVILASSVSKKKGTALRKGSVGYVANPPNGFGRAAVHPDQHACFNYYTSDVIFSRFGFQKEPRNERKNIVGLIPAINNKHERGIAGIISLLEKSPSKVIQETGLSSSVHVLMVPSFDKVDLSTCPSEEFKAWLESFLFSEKVRDIIRNMHEDPKIKQLHGKKLDFTNLEKLMYMAYDRAYKVANIDPLANDIGERRRAFATIQSVLSTAISREASSEIAGVEKGLIVGHFADKNSGIKENRTYNALIKSLFKSAIIGEIETMFLEKLAAQNKNKSSVVTDTVALRNDLLALSRSLRSL